MQNIRFLDQSPRFWFGVDTLFWDTRPLRDTTLRRFEDQNVCRTRFAAVVVCIFCVCISFVRQSMDIGSARLGSESADDVQRLGSVVQEPNRAQQNAQSASGTLRNEAEDQCAAVIVRQHFHLLKRFLGFWSRLPESVYVLYRLRHTSQVSRTLDAGVGTSRMMNKVTTEHLFIVMLKRAGTLR